MGNIRLSTEVKNIIQRMVEISKECKLELINTLVLFDALLLNRCFSTSVEAASSCTMEQISDEVNRILKKESPEKDKGFFKKDFSEEEVHSDEETYILTACIIEAFNTNEVGVKFSQDVADVFTYATRMTVEEKRKEVMFEDIATSFFENLSH